MLYLQDFYVYIRFRLNIKVLQNFPFIMQNLWQISNETWNVSGKFAFDSEKIFVLTSKTELSMIFKGLVKVFNLDVEISETIDMTYLLIEEKIVFITKNSIISFNPESKECINEGQMNGEISSAKWSSNQEFLSIFLNNGTLVLQNSELEITKVHENLGKGPGCIS